MFEKFIEIPQHVKDQHANLKGMIPYVNLKVEKFSPRIKELIVTNKMGEFSSGGKNVLNNKIMKLEDTLNDPSIKTYIDIFNRGLPVVPFPAVERCLGLGVSDAVVELKDG